MTSNDGVARPSPPITQAQLAEKAKISNEFMSAVERGAKLPSLQVLERIASGLRVEMKDLFNFDRTAFRKVEPPSRRMLDLAITLQQLPTEQRRRILKILNTTWLSNRENGTRTSVAPHTLTRRG